MPHNLQHPTVYTPLLSLGRIKHNSDTMSALEARGWGVLGRAGKTILVTGCLMTMTLGESTQDT